MIHKEQWAFEPRWLEYVKSAWKGIGRVEEIKEETTESIEFKARAEQAFSGIGIQYIRVKTYLSVQVPRGGDGYDEGYPHIHYPLDATTLVHYMQPGDVPAPLDIFRDGEVIETVYPIPGLTVFMPNDLMHGVRKNSGTTNRIQLIATALK